MTSEFSFCHVFELELETDAAHAPVKTIFSQRQRKSLKFKLTSAIKMEAKLFDDQSRLVGCGQCNTQGSCE